jgi:hypothetical protein
MANHLHLVGDTPADATWDLGVRCEHCGQAVTCLVGQTLDQLREHLRTAGWFCRGQDDVDSCPPCRKEVLTNGGS